MSKEKPTKGGESASTRVGDTRGRAKGGGARRKRAAESSQPDLPKRVGIQGKKGGPSAPGTKNPERRCTATARNTGERCKRAAIKGGTVCTTHGGNLPQVRKAAKERLLDLVDPALAELHRVLSDKNADDAVKVRAALGILDRTGHGPSAKINVSSSKWDDVIGEMVKDGQVALDRSLPNAERTPALPGGGDHPWEDVEQHATDLQAEAWRDYDAEDAPPERIRPDANTVRGEVVRGRHDPGDPPDHGASRA